MPDVNIQLPYKWRPRSYQNPAWAYLERGGKHAELVWHRRSGKDEVALNWTATAAFERVADYWHMLPEYGQARKAIWDAVNPHTGMRRIDQVFPKEIRRRTADQEMRIEFLNGSAWQVVGSDRFDSLVGSTPAGIVYSEWALANPNARAYFRPIIAENNGWQIFITTPRGRNHALTTLQAARKTPGAFAQVLDATQTDVFTKEQLQAELAAYIAEFGEEYGRAKFEQEYLCSFDAANLGAILARQIAEAEKRGRINDAIEYDPEGSPIEISADIGRRDTATWWFWQPVIGGYHVIDYDSGWGIDAEDWCERLARKLAGRRLGKIWLPHDARAKTFAAKRSAVEIFVGCFGAAHVAITPRSSVADRINAGRVMTQRVAFHETLCQNGLDGLRAWSFEYDDEKKTFGSEPRHDWACFIADTQVRTDCGNYPIQSMRPGMLVRTPSGLRRVLERHEYFHAKFLMRLTLADGREVVCTEPHKFFTARGLVAADGLQYGDILYSGEESPWKWIALISRVAGITGIHQAITDSVRPGSKGERAKNLGNSIGNFTQRCMGQFRRDMKSITWMKILGTIRLVTSNASRLATIGVFMGPRMVGNLLLGTGPMLDEPSTPKWASEIGMESGLLPHFNSRGRLLHSGMEAKKGSAGTPSIRSGSGRVARSLNALAKFAVRCLLRSGARRNSAGRIVRLETFGADTRVYDLTIEGDHCYIANGILSSNSHDGDGYTYGCQIMMQAQPKPQGAEMMRGITVGPQSLSMGVSLDELYRDAAARQIRERV